jgi:hypothetical protein
MENIMKKIILVFLFLCCNFSSANNAYVFDRAANKFLHENKPDKKILVLQWILEKQIASLELLGDYSLSEIYDIQLDSASNACGGDINCAYNIAINALKYIPVAPGSIKQWMSNKSYDLVLSSDSNDKKHKWETYSDGRYKIGIVYNCHKFNNYKSRFCTLGDVMIIQ